MNLWIFLIGYASIQSVLLIYLLISNKGDSKKGLDFLAWMLVVTTYIGARSILIELNYQQTFPLLFFIGLSPMFLIPSLYFLFLSSILGYKKRFVEVLLHLLPFILVSVSQFFSVFSSFKRILFLAFALLLLGYSFSSLMLLRKKQLTKIKSTAVLKSLTYCMIIFSLSVAALYTTKILFKVRSINLSSIIIVFLIVFVTILGIYFSKGINNSFLNLKKYKNSNLQSQDIETLEGQLNELITSERVYLKHDLKADDLAKRLGVSRHQLSEFINQNLGCSFNELINKYRVESVKKDLLDKNKNHLSITGLAQESGFKSQASFYRIFKNNTGQTPSEFIANNS